MKKRRLWPTSTSSPTRGPGGSRSVNGRWSSHSYLPVASSARTLCPASHCLPRTSSLLLKVQEEKSSLTDIDGRTLHVLTTQRTIWAFEQRRSSFMRTLRCAHTLLTYCVCAGGGSDAACWRWYPLSFEKKLEGIRRLSSTIAAKLLVFQAPNLLTYIIDDCALLSSAFEIFFPGFWRSKTLKMAHPRTVNYILSFEFPKKNCSIRKNTKNDEDLRREISIGRFKVYEPLLAKTRKIARFITSAGSTLCVGLLPVKIFQKFKWVKPLL